MEKDENKTLGNNLENENKSEGKTEKTLLNEKEAEKEGFLIVQENAPEKEKEEEVENIEEEEIEAEQKNDPAIVASTEGDELEPEITAEQDQPAPEQAAEHDDLDFDVDDLDGLPFGQDIFKDVMTGEGEQEPSKVKDVKDKMTSEKNAELINKATLLALKKVDLVKAKLCSVVDGKNHFAEYLGDEETIEIFLMAFKAYLEEKEVKEPSPFATLMLALGMWTLPPLGMALLERFNVFDFFMSKEDPKQQAPQARTSKNLNQEQEVSGEAQSDEPKPYAHLKEFKEQRKKFTVNASGKYNHTPNGKKYLPVDLADEFPSPVVIGWIEAGKKNKEIIKLLDYG